MAKFARFTHADALRIAAATRKVERTPQNYVGEQNRQPPQGTKFFAYLTSPGGLNGLWWSWIKVQPVANLPTASDPITMEDDLPLWEFAEPHVTGYQNAREASGNRLEPGQVVELTFIGYDSAGEPAYVFTHADIRPRTEISVHDHRDNFHGGHAFACYHPGTNLPAQPWRV